MNAPPSSTWFSASPDWGWFIVLYFFLGGLAGGSYFLAALIDLVGTREDRGLAHVGYYVAFPFVALSGAILTVDLTRPLRFWHMVVESNTYWPMFKYWSPMSFGVWVLSIFGFFTALSFVATLGERRLVQWPAVKRLRAPGAIGTVVTIGGALSGLYIAGYTGVLLAVSNRPIWADTPLIGLLFIVSATSTSAALIMLLAHRTGVRPPALANLHRFDDWMMVLETLIVIAVIVSLGPVARAWQSVWGVMLFAVVAIGLFVPLALSWRARRGRQWSVVTSTCLVLLGGFFLRAVIVFAGEAI